MSGTASVSVIIPTYNYGAFVGRAIESCLRQTHADVEIIVVDDGSTDDTPQVVAQFGDRIRSLRQDNAGVSAARNRGLEAARGAFVAFLDADDYLTPDSVERRLKALLQSPDAALVVSAWYEQRDGTEERRCRSKFKQDVVSDRFSEWLLRKQFGFATCTAMAPGDLARQFPFPAHISNGEDIAYFAKLCFGRKACWLTHPTAVVTRHPGSLRHDIARIRRQELALVQTIFDDPFYGGALEPLRREFTAGRCLSLFRSLYQAGDGVAARGYYLEALRQRPASILRLGYLGKFLRLALGMGPRRRDGH
ncbi:MAG: hypothetical protein A3K19_12355 [Lentisphaerae bacterium RIFOXYB12_FULL_65_16]|nr:MAG: hypothetical protein A3K18_01870 [Lentisphaerae bacterium RIFOXYA12_64_32]OGV86119.1 MAG: hypothetical protein A3K19_12355 [Lentisphaerae bacterium RIFOXYB12_FULL_65_16]